jgi:hypothetical protein
VDAIVAWNDDGRRSGVFVNTSPRQSELVVADWDDTLEACGTLLRVDAGTGNRVVGGPSRGTVRLDGYGVAVVTNAAVATD